MELDEGTWMGSTEGIKIHTVTTRDALVSMVDRMMSAEHVAFDVETNMLDVHAVDVQHDGKLKLGFRLIGMSFTDCSDEAFYVPLGHSAPKQLTWYSKPIIQLQRDIAMDIMSPIWRDKKIIAHNLKFEYEVMQSLGHPIKHPYFCTLIAQYVLDHRSQLGLKYLSEKLLGRDPWELDELAPDMDLTEVDVSDTSLYAAPDAANCYGLYEIYTQEFQREMDSGNPLLGRVFWNIEMPVMKVVAEMETEGMMLDTGKLSGVDAELGKHADAMLTSMRNALSDQFGNSKISTVSSAPEFDPLKTEHVRAVLYNDPQRFCLAPVSGRGRPTLDGISMSTDEPALKRLMSMNASNKHLTAFLRSLLKWREVNKLHSTYAGSLIELVSSDGRIHPNYRQTRVTTGRLSCQRPNVMNVPRRDDEMDIRRMFTAGGDEWCFVDADYKALEMCIVAFLSGDPVLTRIILGQMRVMDLGNYDGVTSKLKNDWGDPIVLHNHSPVDIHCYTAMSISGTPYPDVDNALRTKFKPVGFGIIYGITKHGLSQQLSISLDEAQTFIDGWLNTFPMVRVFIDSTRDFISKYRYAQTIYGRRRYARELLPEAWADKHIREIIYRALVNMVIQGSAADVVKMAMVKIRHALDQRKLEGYIVLQVHDEIAVRCRVKDAEAVANLVLEAMHTVLERTVNGTLFRIPLDGGVRAVKTLSKSEENLLKGTKLWEAV